MASTTNPVQSLITNSGFSSLYLSTNKVSPSCRLLKTRSSSSRASCLAFPREENKGSVPVGMFAAKPLTFTGWNQTMRRRRSQVEPPVVASAAAADADGREIEIFEGLDLIIILWLPRKKKGVNFDC